MVHAYENYLNESMNVSTSSQESVSKVRKWKEVKTKKVDASQRKVEMEKIKLDTSLLNDYIYVPKIDEIDLIEKIKTKVHSWIFNFALHTTFQANIQGPQYEENWYIDSGCSCHMTTCKDILRDFRKLEHAGVSLAYVERLKYNLISVSELVVGTSNQVIFDVEGWVISNKETKEVLLKSKRKGDILTLDMKPIVDIHSVCLLLKASADLSWL
uniref:Retrovirus-related Pol polyprotein from transposon TNT 1-94-like beta-barrel domain-containing protein n=1 Tax=Lactuca sativa TaxID=4236 RepID=A0A9R1XTI4_LACSA|nr:hypothetical protein LSAT_V11C200063580 [Lactuca sativa]